MEEGIAFFTRINFSVNVVLSVLLMLLLTAVYWSLTEIAAYTSHVSISIDRIAYMHASIASHASHHAYRSHRLYRSHHMHRSHNLTSIAWHVRLRYSLTSLQFLTQEDIDVMACTSDAIHKTYVFLQVFVICTKFCNFTFQRKFISC